MSARPGDADGDKACEQAAVAAQKSKLILANIAVVDSCVLHKPSSPATTRIRGCRGPADAQRT